MADKLDNLKELLGDELYAQVMEKLGDTKIMIDDGNFIPKARFDEVNQAKNDYKKMVDDRHTQLKDLQKKASKHDELATEIEQLREQNQSQADEYEQKIQHQRLDHEIEKALITAEAKNVRAVKALLDLDEVKLTDDGLKGLDSQLEALQESDAYLFGTDGLKGREPHKTKDPPPKTDNPWKHETLNLTEQGRLIREDPEMARKLAAQAGVTLNI